MVRARRAVSERVATAVASVHVLPATDRPRDPRALAAHVERLVAEYDWEAALPPRAFTWRWELAQRVKRVADVVVGTMLLILLSPVFLFAALAVRLSSPGPILFPWRAMGKRGRVFTTYKFRTMVENADEMKVQLLAHNEMRGPVFKMRKDPRITPVGRWLRKFSIDELPQLWSVVRGDMSLVGPRPCFDHEFAGFESWQRGKLSVIPGITCIWQVEGRSEIADFTEWAKLDLDYIQSWSLWLDLKILLRTVPAVLRGHGAY